VFYFISFRASMAIILALLISLLFGKYIIEKLRKKQIGETVRDLGIEGQLEKKGTPTMGGVIILIAIIIPILLLGDLSNTYIILMLVTTLWLGIIGFADDYIKVFKKDKAGLSGWVKIWGQVGVGLIVGVTMLVSDGIIVREKVMLPSGEPKMEIIEDDDAVPGTQPVYVTVDVKNTKTTIPFFKDNEFDYASLLWFLGNKARDWSWLIFIPAIILIVTAVSNGANVTDGLDGLTTGLSAIIGTTLGYTRISFREHHIRRVPEYNVHSLYRRTGNIHGSFYRRQHWLPVVQLLSGPGLHGRYRKPVSGWHYCRICNSHTQGIADPYPVRNIFR
jgi:phospho-N-acetylmuramoyl-pentapeptide-transferase